MKTIYILLITLLYTSSSYCIESKNIIEVSERINSISLLKNNNGHNKFNKTYDPFKIAKPIIKTDNVVRTSYKSDQINLQTILNERAFINSRWYNTGEKIQDYKIDFISKNSVVLSKGLSKKIIKIKNTKSIIKYTDIINIKEVKSIKNATGEIK